MLQNCQNKPRRNISSSIRRIAHNLNLPLSGVGELLKEMRDHHPSLPKDPRTLLQTPRYCRLRKIAGGSYVHIGLKAGLIHILRDVEDNITEVGIQLNVDGMRAFNSSRCQLWPIQCRLVHPFLCRPFVVGVYCGKQKPTDVHAFMAEALTELSELLEQGLCLPWKCTVHPRGVICDSPTRAFLKQIKGHTGYYACEFCTHYGRHLETCERKNRIFEEISTY